MKKHPKFEQVNDPFEIPSFPENLRINGFSVPEGYFDKLPLQIVDKIHYNTVPPFFTLPRLAVIVTILAFVLIAGGAYFFTSSMNEKAEITLTYDEILRSGITYEMDEQFLLEHYYSLPAVTNENEDATELQKSMNDYLIENNIDITLIINEL
jgi:hypothetical protein